MNIAGRRILVVFIAAAILSVPAAYLWWHSPKQVSQSSLQQSRFVSKLRFADAPTVFWTAPTIIARTDELFAQVKLEVEILSLQTGLAAKNAVLTGNADVGLVASTPVAAGFASNEKSRIIATYVVSNEVLRIGTLARPDSEAINTTVLGLPEVVRVFKAGKVGSEDLHVGFVPNTISSRFLDDVLAYCFTEHSGEKPTREELRKSVGAIGVRPDGAAEALRTGEVNFLVAWEPLLLLATHDPDGRPTGASLRTMSAGDFSSAAGAAATGPTFMLHLVTRDDVLNNPTKLDALVKFVRAVDLACERLGSPPSLQYQAQIETLLNHPKGMLDDVWVKVAYGVQGLGSYDLINQWKIRIVEDLKAESEKICGHPNGDLADQAVSTRVLELLLAEDTAEKGAP